MSLEDYDQLVPITIEGNKDLVGLLPDEADNEKGEDGEVMFALSVKMWYV